MVFGWVAIFYVIFINDEKGCIPVYRKYTRDAPNKQKIKELISFKSRN